MKTPRLTRRNVIITSALGVTGLAAARLLLPSDQGAAEVETALAPKTPTPTDVPATQEPTATLEATPTEQPAEPPPEEPPPGPAEALLEGSWLSPEEAAVVNARLPVAVMLDNLPFGARPQIGMDRADLVYEGLVEGGITRFMAVYHRHESALIEPVRSVRTPFVHIARELAAIVAHVGASETQGGADAKYLLQYWGLPHVDGDELKHLFWRDPSRRAPHNAGVSTMVMREEAAAWGFHGPPELGTWLFKDDGEPANAISAGATRAAYGFIVGRIIASADFNVEWRYDQGTNSYQRVMGGVRHVDPLTGTWLSFKNVVVQFQTASVITNEGHVIYEQVGEGPARVFRDGQIIEAKWTCRWIGDRTRYWDANGDEVRFNRGPSWVTLLSPGSPFSWG